jgi:hypothetical protein
MSKMFRPGVLVPKLHIGCKGGEMVTYLDVVDMHWEIYVVRSATVPMAVCGYMCAASRVPSVGVAIEMIDRSLRCLIWLVAVVFR